LYHEQVFLLLIFSLLLNIPDFLFQLNIDAWLSVIINSSFEKLLAESAG
jgi:hypothetical protein